MLRRVHEKLDIFQWTFDGLPEPVNPQPVHDIQSQTFSLIGYDDIRWFLVCEPKYQRRSNRTQLAGYQPPEDLETLRFRLVKDYDNSVICDVRLTAAFAIVGTNDRLYNMQYYEHRPSNNNNNNNNNVATTSNDLTTLADNVTPTSEFYPMMAGKCRLKKKPFLNWRQLNEKRELFFHRGHLMVEVKIVVERVVYSRKAGFGKTNFAQMFRNAKRFLNDDAFTDVQLTVDGQQFKVHKLVLAGQSPVFESMFTRDMVEQRTSQVHIDGISAGVFKKFLNYLYTGKIKCNWPISEQLIVVADRYQVEPLKWACENEMIERLSVNNCLEYLRIADMVNANRLLIQAIEFIHKKHQRLETIANFDAFFQRHPNLLILLYKAFKPFFKYDDTTTIERVVDDSFIDSDNEDSDNTVVDDDVMLIEPQKKKSKSY